MEQRDTIEVTWNEIKLSVQNVNQDMYNIINKLDVDDSFTLYLCKFKYGDQVGNDKTFYLPEADSLNTLDQYKTTSNIYKNLKYAYSSFPLSLVLEKQLEWYITDEVSGRSSPTFIYCPGELLNVAKALQKREDIKHAPNGLMSGQAGIKSTFLLQKLGCSESQSRLKKASLHIPTTKSYDMHSEAFRIIQSEIKKTNWLCSVLYFSEAWIHNINNNPEWKSLKKYLGDYNTPAREFINYSWHYRRMFSDANRRTNTKNNIFIQNVSSHLFEILVGGKLGFVPADSNSGLPLDTIISTYKDIYKLNSEPVAMVPALFNNTQNVYFSLNYPCFEEFDDNSRKRKSKLVELELLHDQILSYRKLFTLPIKSCAGTLLESRSNDVSFKFTHNLTTNNKKKFNGLKVCSQLKVQIQFLKKYLTQNFLLKHLFFKGV